MIDNADYTHAIAEAVAEKLAEGIRDGKFLPVGRYLTPAQAAAYLGLTEAGLETMRKEKRGPLYSRPSNKLVRYRIADLDGWLAEHIVTPGE